MLWNDLSHEWQEAFLEAWEAFKHGSIPIGAVIADDEGNILSVGRNRTAENEILNPKLAHAEMMCLSNLDTQKYPDVKKYVLYTTMEPCPMCIGTIVMANIRNVRVASADRYCGSVHLLYADDYVRSKKINAVIEKGELQDVALAMHSYYNRKLGVGSRIVEMFRLDSSKAVDAAEEMLQDRYLDRCVENDVPYEEVFNHILDVIQNQKN